MKYRKSQVSMEFLLTTGIFLLVFIGVLALTHSKKVEILDFKEEMEIKSPCTYFSSILSNVYALGPGTEMTSSLDYNITVLGKTNQIMAWKMKEGRNVTYYCTYPSFDVTNTYNTSFTIPRFTNFTVVNRNNVIEVRESVLDNGIVLWLKMDEVNQSGGTNTSPDLSDYKHKAELIGSIDCTQEGYEGRTNGCLFDGTDDYITITDANSLEPNNLTISAWIKPASVPSGEWMIVDKYSTSGGYKLYIKGDSGLIKIGAIVLDPTNDDSNAETAVGVIPTVWYNVIFTFNEDNDNKIKIYLNGKKESLGIDTAAITPSLSNSMPLLIGKSQNNDKYFTGKIDEVIVYNRALSEQEVSRLNMSYFNYANVMGEGLVR